MRFYNELKNLFPMLNKKAYYEANKSHLGVKLRRFQQWFHSQASDKEAIKAKIFSSKSARTWQNFDFCAQFDFRFW